MATTVRRWCTRTAATCPAQAMAYNQVLCTSLLHLVLTLWALDFPTTTTTPGRTAGDRARFIGDGAAMTNERILTQILMLTVGYQFLRSQRL
jgi:hypothetical protein